MRCIASHLHQKGFLLSFFLQSPTRRKPPACELSRSEMNLLVFPDVFRRIHLHRKGILKLRFQVFPTDSLEQGSRLGGSQAADILHVVSSRHARCVEARARPQGTPTPDEGSDERLSPFSFRPAFVENGRIWHSEYFSAEPRFTRLSQGCLFQLRFPSAIPLHRRSLRLDLRLLHAPPPPSTTAQGSAAPPRQQQPQQPVFSEIGRTQLFLQNLLANSAGTLISSDVVFPEHTDFGSIRLLLFPVPPEDLPESAVSLRTVLQEKLRRTFLDLESIAAPLAPPFGPIPWQHRDIEPSSAGGPLPTPLHALLSVVNFIENSDCLALHFLHTVALRTRKELDAFHGKFLVEHHVQRPEFPLCSDPTTQNQRRRVARGVRKFGPHLHMTLTAHPPVQPDVHTVLFQLTKWRRGDPTTAAAESSSLSISPSSATAAAAAATVVDFRAEEKVPEQQEMEQKQGGRKEQESKQQRGIDSTLLGSDREHLIILCHGFLGKPTDLLGVRNFIMESFPRVHCHLAQSYADHTPSMSIQEMARRLAIETALAANELFCASSGRAPSITFICHSMGGLVARLAVTRREMSHLTDHLWSLLTFGTPHLGLAYHRNHRSTMGISLIRISSASDTQCLDELQLADSGGGSQSLVFQLAQKQPGIGLFRHVWIAASESDSTVPYHSGLWIMARKPEVLLQLREQRKRGGGGGGGTESNSVRTARLYRDMILGLEEQVQRPGSRVESFTRINAAFDLRNTSFAEHLVGGAHVAFLSDASFSKILVSRFPHLLDPLQPAPTGEEEEKDV